MWFLFSTYFIIFLQDDLIHCMVNNRIFILLYVKFISVCGIVPTVLSRPTFSILRNKISQDPSFIWLMPGSTYETCGFGSILKMIYISFFALFGALTHFGVNIWWGNFSSYFPAVNRTVGIFPSRLFYKKVLLHICKYIILL